MHQHTTYTCLLYTSRLGNPTQGVFEQRIAALEGGTAALAVASGAAAICYTIQNLAKQADHIISANNIYGGTYNLLAHTLVDYGVTTTFVAVSYTHLLCFYALAEATMAAGLPAGV